MPEAPRYEIISGVEYAREVAGLKRKFPRVEGDIKKFLDKELAVHPKESGDPIPGVAGMRKARCGIPSANIGKRGGLRIIYAVVEKPALIGLARVYYKGDTEDLTRVELRRALEAVAPRLEVAVRERGGDPQLVQGHFQKLLGP